MSNTTFSGPVRSQNGFKIVNKAASGLVQDFTNNSGTDLRRYALQEYFKQKPALNAVIGLPGSDTTSPTAAALAAYTIANKDFEVLGTNMTTALATFSATRAGITITTAGADQDQAIVCPHLDTNQTTWSTTKWGTENQVTWEATISTGASIADVKIWAGLKLTNDQLVATDADQAFFKFQTDATNSEAFTDYTLLHFVHSIGGTDYISALPITVAASTTYQLKIEIDSARKLSIFVDGIQYDITTTAGSTGGTAVVQGTLKSAAMTNDVDLIPYIGVEAGAAAAKAIDIHYEGISRVIFE